MLVRDQPGCWAAAARLPKKPGIQKLTPPSSAAATDGTLMRAPRTAMQCLNLSRDMPCPQWFCAVRDGDSPNQFNGMRAARANVFAGEARIPITCGANVTVSHRRDTCFEAPI